MTEALPLVLTWTHFDEAVAILADRISMMIAMESELVITSLYGVPRGGLVLAVALSHRLALPLSPEPVPECLIVDDVTETGKTIRSLLACAPNQRVAVWCNKSEQVITCVHRVPADRWIVFPWEDRNKAAADAEAYYASRK